MNHPASYLRVGALALLWGASFLLIKLALTALSPVQVAFTRIALGAAVLVVLCALRGIRLRGDRRLWAHVAVAGFFASALPWVLFSMAERTVDSGLAGVLNATTPLWTILFGFLAGTQRDVPPRMLAGLAIGFGGVLLIMAPWDATASGIGLLACLGATASYGIAYVHIGRNLTASRDGGPAPVPLATAGMQLVAATGIAAFALPLDGLPPVRFDLVALLAVAVLGVFGTGVGFALNYRLIADEGPTAAATVTYLMPIVSVLLGALVLGEQIGPRVVLGIALVLAGVALTRRTNRPSRRRLPPAARVFTDLTTNHPMK
ncbi:DMT family transporter [Saccharopolyspora sp. NPDC002578]